MELELLRQDLVQTGTCAPSTLAVLPLTEEKKNQKVVLGDLSGVVQCFSIKKGEFSFAFKTLPGPKVTSLSLGKGRQQRDRIFLAAGSQVKGFSRKGKEFFKYNTQLTERIRRINVLDKNIYVAGEYIHNHFIEVKDAGLFLCPDKINDAEVVPLEKADELFPVLACQDRNMRVLAGSNVLYEVATQSAPTVAKFVLDAHDAQHRFPHGREVLYGTEAGTLVQLMMEPALARQGFVHHNPKKLGAVRCIFSGIDFTKTGSNNIVVGRDDGVLEVLDVEETGDTRQVFTVKLAESINALDGGYVTSLNAQELLVHTFAGKVLSYTPPGAGLLLPQAETTGRGKAAAQAVSMTEQEQRRLSYQSQIARLKSELETMRNDLEAERNKFQSRGGNASSLTAAAPFVVNDRLKLEAEEACYVLLLESAVPIFAVALQCTTRLQLLDVPSNVAILSRSPPDEPNNTLTLATYRCQDSTSRLAIKFKAREGKPAMLTAFIIPQVSPKSCVSVKHMIRPLCLHQRVTQLDASRPTNDLVLTGTFSLGEVHSWITSLLPDLPPMLPAGQDHAAYTFQNTLLGTQLACRYMAGEARFTSDLISTLGIVHEHLMREATASKQRVQVSFSPSPQSLAHSVALVWPQLEKQRQLTNQHALLEGLQELKMQDGDVSYLAPDFKSMLDHAAKIRAAYREQPQHLDHLCALIRDLYLDYAKLTGIPAPKQRLPALEHLLAQTSSTLDQVMDFMLNRQA